MTALYLIIAAAVVVLAIIAIIAVRRDRARMFSASGAGDLTRECSNCGRSLRAAATTCPHCGSDTVVLIV